MGDATSGQVTRPVTPKGAARTAQSVAAEAAYRSRLAELGAALLEPQWLGGHRPHRIRCAAGHECAPRPSDVLRRQGACDRCGHRQIDGPIAQAAEAAFRVRLAEIGAVLLELEWLGAASPHRVRCAEGHECTPYPCFVQQGGGICKVCARVDPVTAEAAFRAVLAELGATLLEPEWLGVGKPHLVRCAAGHESRPRPSNVTLRKGICITCAGQDPTVAEAAFRARLDELGATPLFDQWLGVKQPHHVRCAAGHDCYPRPGGVLKGVGICRTCAGRDSIAAEAEFRARLAVLGVTLLEPRWLGTQFPHRARCAAGHECSPRPGGLKRGRGVCRTCAGKGNPWDCFYVVTGRRAVKFGITSGDPRPRLSDHRRAGYREVVRTLTGLLGALNLEQDVRKTLTLAGIRPLRGREHYDISALPVILDVADNYLFGAQDPVRLPVLRVL